MKDRLKKVWEDRKRYVKPAALLGGVGVLAAVVVRSSHKESISETVEDDSIKIDNWVDGEGRGLTRGPRPDHGTRLHLRRLSCGSHL